MNLKRLASETMLYGLSSIVGRFLNYLLLPLYTRTFLQGEYGVVSELFAYAGFMMVFFSYRMESALFRFGTPPEDRERAYTTTVFSIFGTTAFLLSAILLFANPISNFLDYPDHPEYIRWFGLILAFDCLAELPFARLRLEQRPLRFVFAKLFNIGVNGVLNLFWLLFCPWAAKNGMTWVYAVWSPGIGVGYVFMANMIASGLTLLLMLPELTASFRGKFDAVLWRKMMVYTLPLVVVSFAGIVNEMLDRAILTRILPGTLAENRAQLGIYGANYKLAMLITLFTQAYRYAAEPFFFKTAGQKDAPAIQAKATKWFTIVASAGMLGVLLFLDIIKDFLGPDFHGGLHIVPILLLANVLLGVYYNFSVWFRLKDRTMTGAWISLAGAALTLIFNLLWVPVLGYTGAAWATLACYAFMAGATWLTGRKIYPVPYPLLKMVGYVGLTLVLWVVSLWLKKHIAGGQVLVFAANVGLFLSFFGVVWFVEKKDFRHD